MLSIKRLLVAAAAVSLSTGVAVGASKQAETSPVTAEFQGSLVSQDQRTCDPAHVELRLRFQGSLTSSDPRLAGDFDLRVRSVVNTQNGYGHNTSHVVVRDSVTGLAKFRGTVVGVLQPAGGIEGIVVGRTIGPKSLRLVANFNASLVDPGLRGEIGRDTQTGPFQDPAVLSNACRF